MPIITKTLFLVTFLFTIIVNAQEIKLPTNLEDINNVYHQQAFDKNYFLFFDAKKSEVIKTDAKLNVEKTVDIAVDLKSNLFSSVIFNNENSLTTFWLTNKDINAVTTDLTNGTNTLAEPFLLKEKGERILTTFIDNDLFYVLKIINRTSTLKLISLDTNLNVKDETLLDFSEKEFISSPTQSFNLFQVLRSDLAPSLVFVENDKESNLIISSAKNKYYVKQNKLYITIDIFKRSTHLLTIDLLSKAKSHEIFDQNYDRTEAVFYSSNSFLFDDKLIQLCGGYRFLNFIIRDLSGTIIKEHSIFYNRDSDFITGDVVMYTDIKFIRDHSKEIDKPNRILRKIGGATFKGIFVTPVDDNYIVRFGKVRELKSIDAYNGKGGALMPLVFSPFQTSIFNEYFNSEATIATTVLDQDFNPNPSFQMEEDKLAKIRKDRTINIKDKKYKTLLKINDQDYYGKQEKKSNTFDLVPY